MATLGDIGVSAFINIVGAIAFLLAFALLRIQPVNDRVYFPKWYLSLFNCWTYLTFLNWMPQAMRVTEAEIINHICWPWLCCFPQNLHFGVTSIFLSSISLFLCICSFVWFSDQVLEFWVIYHGFISWVSSKKVWNITTGSSFSIHMQGSIKWISFWELFISREIMFGM